MYYFHLMSFDAQVHHCYFIVRCVVFTTSTDVALLGVLMLTFDIHDVIFPLFKCSLFESFYNVVSFWYLCEVLPAVYCNSLYIYAPSQIKL